MKHLKRFNEGLFSWEGKEVTFPAVRKLGAGTPFGRRLKFKVEDIATEMNPDNDVIFLSNVDDDSETIEMTRSGQINLHYKNGHRMLQTYNVDDKTLKELSSIPREDW